ncbi:MAG: hypothetical protein WCH93_12560 [Actinomycetota bacterium]
MAGRKTHGTRLRTARAERLGRATIKACKQCGRTTLLEIAPPATLAAGMATSSGAPSA